MQEPDTKDADLVLIDVGLACPATDLDCGYSQCTDRLLSEFFKNFSGVILGVCETTWRLSGGHFEGVWGEIRGENY